MTPQHHIIKETSGTISRLLQDEFKRNGYKRIHVVEQAPKPEAIEGKLPAVSIYLYQVSVDHLGVQHHITHEVVNVERGDGSVQEFSRRSKLWIRLDYLISAFAQTPEDEQLLLGLIIRTIGDNPALLGEHLRGESFEEGFKLPLRMAGRMEEGALSRFWGGMSQPVRPAIQAWTQIPIVPNVMEPISRVRKAPQLSYRNLNDPRQQPETGPQRSGISLRRQLDPERGGR